MRKLRFRVRAFIEKQVVSTHSITFCINKRSRYGIKNTNTTCILFFVRTYTHNTIVYLSDCTLFLAPFTRVCKCFNIFCFRRRSFKTLWKEIELYNMRLCSVCNMYIHLGTTTDFSIHIECSSCCALLLE